MVSKIKEKSIANNAITPAKLSSEAGAATGVKVSSIVYLNDDTAVNTIGGDVITVNGAGFTPNTVVYVDRTQAGVVTYLSNTQITFSSPAKTAGSYILYLYNADGGSAAYIPGINYSGVPAWSTASGSIGTTYEFTSFSGNVTTLSATSDSTVYYLLNSGSLPTGASLNANTGVITGNTGVVNSQTTYNFVIEAKDQENQGTLRNFSITINPDTVTWSSPADGTLYNITVGGAVNQALSATSAATRGITYTANTLPAGLSISGSNVTGTPSAVANTTSLITATSATTNRSATRTLLWYAKSVPGQPTIGTATQTGTTSATVTFTAPASNGNSPITSYTAVSSPGGITGTLSQAGSGTITVNGLTPATPYTFTVYATNAAGNSTSSTTSNQITTQNANPPSVEYLVVAGGAGGGKAVGGAGGAGGYLASTLSVSASTAYTVTVGSGGPGGTIRTSSAPQQGSPSVFSSVSTVGGGGGGCNNGGVVAASSGGSGGGGCGESGVDGGAGASGTGGQGNSGGHGSTNAGGGGGGAGSTGGAAPSGGSTGGGGGSGSASSITGVSVTYAGGGGGGSVGGTVGNGVASGGTNNGTNNDNTAGSAGSNTGSGGGGGGFSGSGGNGGNGGSGVVIIAYPSSYVNLSSISGGLTYTFDNGVTRSGYKVYKFTAGTGPISW
jgi:hypothetical protein